MDANEHESLRMMFLLHVCFFAGQPRAPALWRASRPFISAFVSISVYSWFLKCQRGNLREPRQRRYAALPCSKNHYRSGSTKSNIDEED
jgi:hypothetical protein